MCLYVCVSARFGFLVYTCVFVCMCGISETNFLAGPHHYYLRRSEVNALIAIARYLRLMPCCVVQCTYDRWLLLLVFNFFIYIYFGSFGCAIYARAGATTTATPRAAYIYRGARGREVCAFVIHSFLAL